ncbi:hypothetical protein BJX66DRAFT_338397 [Aspergillus keveii]|uniref:GPI anchored protein n=1 Tax=Aspergillus keveii TaxID=714993 RepID=A0ABR4G4P9_9EURO
MISTPSPSPARLSTGVSTLARITPGLLFSTTSPTSLEKWSLPKLSYANEISVTIPFELDNLEFPALTEFGTTEIRGNLSSISFDSLKTVRFRLSIGNRYSVDDVTLQTKTSMNISLPALENITAFNVVHLPNLENWDWLSVESFLPFNCTALEGQFNATKTRLAGDERDRSVTCTSFPAPENSAIGVYARGFASMVVFAVAVLGAGVGLFS